MWVIRDKYGKFVNEFASQGVAYNYYDDNDGYNIGWTVQYEEEGKVSWDTTF